MRHKPYIAELHDIGKLADREALQRTGLKISGHTFHDFDFTQLDIQPPSSPSWWGQWSDSIKSLEAASGLPSSITDAGKGYIVLTKIADTLAASISRTWGEKGEVAEGVRLLWNPNFYEKTGKHWAAFRTREELKQMFAFINECQVPEEFFQKYEENLRLTPEDKSVPLNFISLGIHLDLTGKVFRVLHHWSELVEYEGKPQLEYDNERIVSVTEAAGDRASGHNRGKWVFRLLQCHVRFPQSLVRLQDLNVLRLRSQKIQEIAQKQKILDDVERQPYAVLFHTDDFLCLFMPKEPLLPLPQVLQPLLAEGFWIECEELEAELNLLTSTGARTRQQLIEKWGSRDKAHEKRSFELRYRSMWPDLEKEIVPPLCDLCQQRKGELYIKDQIHEWLCPVCRKIRDMGEPATQFAQWDKEGKPVAWIKISLNQELLLQCLHSLFNDYVDNGPSMGQVSEDDRTELKKSFRPLAAQMEFVRHYQQFLEDFQAQLYRVNIEPETVLYPISEYKELIIIRLDQEEILGLVLDSFLQILQERFPKCLEDCPIRLAASASNIKYPYHEHWRFFEEEQKPGVIFDLQQPGIRRVQLTASQFQALRRELKDEKLSHFLHRLAQIEAKAGEVFATVEALNERHKFPQLLKLLEQHKLTFRQILDFYRLSGITGELSTHVR
ncbi:MAG: hypothetical protein QXS96_07600 [Candidatus Caldarchaeum sp.]